MAVKDGEGGEDSGDALGSREEARSCCLAVQNENLSGQRASNLHGKVWH